MKEGQLIRIAEALESIDKTLSDTAEILKGIEQNLDRCICCSANYLHLLSSH